MDRNPAYTVYRCLLGMNQRNRTVSKAYGTELSVLESGALPEIIGTPGISASTLGPRLILEQVPTSRLIASLKEKNLIRESSAAYDKRKKELYVTAHGEKVFTAMQAREYGTFSAAFEKLSSTEQKRFTTYLNEFCRGWESPEVVSLPTDPPLMAEIRMISRKMGLLNSKVFGMNEFSPLEWHILAHLALQSREVTGAECALRYGVPPNTISDVVTRLFKRKLLIRISHGTDKRCKFLKITERGRKEYEIIEQNAVAQIQTALKMLTEDEREEYAKLWLRYSGEDADTSEIFLGPAASLRQLNAERDLAIARQFIFGGRVKKKCLEDIPPQVAHPDSYVYALFCRGRLNAVLELSETVHQKEGELLHFVEETPEKDILSDFITAALEQFELQTGVKTLFISKKRADTSHFASFEKITRRMVLQFI